MKDLNKVQLIGNLGKDPEIHHAANGTVRTKFSVASNRRWTDQAGDVQQETEWFNVVAFGKLAEICGDYLNKGSLVYVEGRLHTSVSEDAESGQKRYWIEVVASDMIMLDRKSGAPEPDAADEVEPSPRERATTKATASRRRRASVAADDVL